MASNQQAPTPLKRRQIAIVFLFFIFAAVLSAMAFYVVITEDIPEALPNIFQIANATNDVNFNTMTDASNTALEAANSGFNFVTGNTTDPNTATIDNLFVDDEAVGTYVIANWENARRWLEQVGLLRTREARANYAYISTNVTVGNLVSEFEIPGGQMNTMLREIRNYLIANLSPSLSGSSVSSCLAVQDDLSGLMEREIYLYLRVPEDLNAFLPADWYRFDAPIVDDERWYTDCYDPAIDRDNAALIAEVSADGVRRQSFDADNLVVGVIDEDAAIVEARLNLLDTSHVDLTMNVTSGNLDPLLMLVNREGLVLAQSEATSRTAQLSYPHIAAGDYTVVASRRGLPNGDTIGAFELAADIRVVNPESALTYESTAEERIAAGYPVLPAHEQAAWTIFLYYAGDSDLQASLTQSLADIAALENHTAQVRVIALLDTPNGARLYEVAHERIADETEANSTNNTGIYGTLLAEMGPLASTEGETLAQFLVWAGGVYPADQYALVLGGHGIAWAGILHDVSAELSIMPLPELETALRAVIEALNIQQFDMIVTNADTMGSLEYFSIIDAFANLALSSADVIFNGGFDIALLISQLNDAVASGNVDLEGIAAQTIDDYIQRQDQDFSIRSQYATAALTRMDDIEALINATERFARLVNTDPARYAQIIGHARHRASGYNAFIGQTSFLNLRDFMRLIAEESHDRELTNIAQNVFDALDRSHIYGSAGTQAITKQSYYNIYFPLKPEEFESVYIRANLLPEWGQMVRHYYIYATDARYPQSNMTTLFHAPKVPELIIDAFVPSAVSVLQPTVAQLQLVGRDFGHLTTHFSRFVDSTNHARLLTTVTNQAWDTGVDTGTITWDATVYELTDGTTNGYGTLYRAVDNSLNFYLLGRYLPNGTTINNNDASDVEAVWQDVVVPFRRSDDPNILVSDLNLQLLELPHVPAVKDIPTKPQFQVYVDMVDNAGTVRRELGETFRWQMDGLQAVRRAVPSGSFEIENEVTNFGTLSTITRHNVYVNNPSDADIYTGLNAIEPFGITLAGIGEWFDGSQVLSNSDTQRETRIIVEDAHVIVSIERYPVMDAPLEAFVLERLPSIQNFTEAQPSFETIDVAGYTALEFRIQMAEQIVRGFVTYDDARRQMLVLETRVDDGSNDALNLAYETILNTLWIHPALSQSQEWRVRTINDTIQFSLPSTWVELPESLLSPEIYYLQDQNPWRVFAADARIPVRVALSQQPSENTPSTLVTQIIEFVLPEAERTLPQTYNNGMHEWTYITYTLDDRRGRFYVTQNNDASYVIWIESPTTVFMRLVRTAFEPMVDSLIIAPEFHILEYTGHNVRFPEVLRENWTPFMYDASNEQLMQRTHDGEKSIFMSVVPDIVSDEALAEAMENVRGSTGIGVVDSSLATVLDRVVQTSQSNNSAEFVGLRDETRQLGLTIGAIGLDDAASLNLGVLQRNASFMRNTAYEPMQAFSNLNHLTPHIVSNTRKQYGFDFEINELFVTHATEELFNVQPGLDQINIPLHDLNLTISILHENTDELDALPQTFCTLLAEAQVCDTLTDATTETDFPVAQRVHRGETGAWLVANNPQRHKAYLITIAMHEDTPTDVWQAPFALLQGSLELVPLADTTAN